MLKNKQFYYTVEILFGLQKNIVQQAEKPVRYRDLVLINWEYY